MSPLKSATSASPVNFIILTLPYNLPPFKLWYNLTASCHASASRHIIIFPFAFSYNVLSNNSDICFPNIAILLGRKIASNAPSQRWMSSFQLIVFSKNIISSLDASGFLYLALEFGSQLLAIK